RVKGALSDDTAAAQEHEAIADLRGIGDLVDRQEERAIRREMPAQRGSRFAALAQVQAFERFIDQEYRLRSEQPESKQNAFALSLGQSADRDSHQRCQGEVGDNRLIDFAASAKEAEAVFQHPMHWLFWPRGNAVRNIEKLG